MLTLHIIPAVQVYYAVGDAVIEFELLDAPPYASDISGPIFQSPSLQQATQRLNDAVTSGSLYINVWDSATQQISKVCSCTRLMVVCILYMYFSKAFLSHDNIICFSVRLRVRIRTRVHSKRCIRSTCPHAMDVQTVASIAV